LVVFKDITADRAKEQAELKAHDEAMMAKAMGESMVTLTHELRTPLQGIMGVTSLLLQQTGDLNTETLESLKLIMASSSLLLNLINNLLDVKKATAKSKSR
jgi:signal transduction histidine kinase